MRWLPRAQLRASAFPLTPCALCGARNAVFACAVADLRVSVGNCWMRVPCTVAAFCPELAAQPLELDVVEAAPHDASAPLRTPTHGGSYAGAAVLVDRGGDRFATVVAHCADAGAAAVIVCDAEGSARLGCMGGAAAEAAPPAVLVPWEVGAFLRASIQANGGVQCRLGAWRRCALRRAVGDG